MNSPAELAIKTAEKDLDKKKSDAVIRMRRVEIIGNIEHAIRALDYDTPAILEDFSVTDDQSLGIVVTRKPDMSNIRRGKTTLDIKGSLKDNESEHSVDFPVYRVSKITPKTDGGNLESHYEISAADQSTASGYRPLALIEQQHTRGSSRVAHDIFEVHDLLDPKDIKGIQETGLCVDPRAAEMLNEVQDILAKVAG